MYFTTMLGRGAARSALLALACVLPARELSAQEICDADLPPWECLGERVACAEGWLQPGVPENRAANGAWDIWRVEKPSRTEVTLALKAEKLPLPDTAKHFVVAAQVGEGPIVISYSEVDPQQEDVQLNAQVFEVQNGELKVLADSNANLIGGVTIAGTSCTDDEQFRLHGHLLKVRVDVPAAQAADLKLWLGFHALGGQSVPSIRQGYPDASPWCADDTDGDCAITYLQCDGSDDCATVVCATGDTSCETEAAWPVLDRLPDALVALGPVADCERAPLCQECAACACPDGAQCDCQPAEECACVGPDCPDDGIAGDGGLPADGGAGGEGALAGEGGVASDGGSAGDGGTAGDGGVSGEGGTAGKGDGCHDNCCCRAVGVSGAESPASTGWALALLAGVGLIVARRRPRTAK